MTAMESGRVGRAAAAFARGDYERAHQLYAELAALAGSDLFRANLVLCERRLAEPLSAPAPRSAEAQLAETQRLLEAYHRRCQVLEQQLAATKAASGDNRPDERGGEP